MTHHQEPPVGEARRDRGPVILHTDILAVDDSAAALLAARLEQAARDVTSEPGLLAYSVLASTGDPTALFVTETWATGADAQRHIDRVACSGAVEAIAPLLREDLNTISFVRLAEADAERKSA